MRLDQLEQELEDANASNKKLQDESDELRRRISEVEARNDELRKQIHESQKSQEAMWSRWQVLWMKMKKDESSDATPPSSLQVPTKQESA